MVDQAMAVTNRDTRRRLSMFAAAILGIALVAPLALTQNTTKPEDKQEKSRSSKSAGFVFSEDATAKDVGLPIYPGAQRLKDSDESAALQMGLWGGSSGFKLVVLKLESDDPAETIVAFYRKALSRYGKVLDCSNPSAKQESSDSGHGNRIDCENDRPTAGSFALKAGTKQSQHIVGVEPDGKRTKISLVYVWTRKPENKGD